LIPFAVRVWRDKQGFPNLNSLPEHLLLLLSGNAPSSLPDFSIRLLIFFSAAGSAVINDRSGLGGNLILPSSNTGEMFSGWFDCHRVTGVSLKGHLYHSSKNEWSDLKILSFMNPIL